MIGIVLEILFRLPKAQISCLFYKASDEMLSDIQMKTRNNNTPRESFQGTLLALASFSANKFNLNSNHKNHRIVLVGKDL